MSIFDRLVEDQNFYVKVQKTKLIIAVICVPIAIAVVYWRGY